ncbi:unnamed protein product [Lactuca virosa]|uniref:DUF760 domain-containing protein n=1 Tax=Lactuca virosa TaxID=75947 RepID=A0AAU9NAQ1_9ASTR|nr:unnamed protein product [Lactuca virosa]
MSFLTLKTPFISSHSSSSSSVLASCQSNQLLRLCSSSSLYVARKRTFSRGKLRWRAESQQQDSSQNSNSSDSKQPNGSVTSRRDILLEYVKNVQPEFMELFVKRAPQQVVDAMRQTVTNMIGTLPPQFFAVTVTTVAENLAQLMYSVLMTGYMFRNAQYRLELQQSLEQVALPDTSSQERKDAADFAPGTQKKVERISANGSNELLDYLKSLEPQNLKDLTSSAGEDVVVAMNTFIKRLLAVSDPTQMKTSVTETSAPELAKLLYWLMVVGYSIRNIEVRFDMERVLGSPPKRQELPPAENI